jgi:hypothetical protein
MKIFLIRDYLFTLGAKPFFYHKEANSKKLIEASYNTAIACINKKGYSQIEKISDLLSISNFCQEYLPKAKFSKNFSRSIFKSPDNLLAYLNEQSTILSSEQFLKLLQLAIVTFIIKNSQYKEEIEVASKKFKENWGSYSGLCSTVNHPVY